LCDCVHVCSTDNAVIALIPAPFIKIQYCTSALHTIFKGLAAPSYQSIHLDLHAVSAVEVSRVRGKQQALSTVEGGRVREKQQVFMARLTNAAQQEHCEDDAENDGNSVAARGVLGVSLPALPGGIARVRPVA
jgi:hypothetical protein